MPGNRIFICYRRDDTSGYAGRLYDQLAARFGRDNVFMDVDAIKPGADFAAVAGAAAASSQAVLILIGRDWLSAATADGTRRLDDPNDFVRQEIVSALESQRLVIPVLVGGAKMPQSNDLPEAISSLSRRNAVTLTDSSWKADVQGLIQTVQSGALRFSIPRTYQLIGIGGLIVAVALGGLLLTGLPHVPWLPLASASPGRAGGGPSPTPLEARLTVTPTSVDLGTVVVGSRGPLVTVTVANIGNGKARVTTHLSDTSDFTIQDGCTGSQLGPNQQCSLGINFAPMTAGTLDAILSVSVDNGTTPQPVTLTGIGKAPPTAPPAPPTSPPTKQPTPATGLIRGIYGLCVDDLSSTTTNGNPIIVWQCAGTSNQEWTVEGDGTLRVLGKCMDIAGGNSADFTPIDLNDCNGGANQVWQPLPNGEIVNPQSGKCLDDQGSGDAGTHLILYTCAGTPNQIWILP